jgi:hypothetical protein
MIHAFTSRLTSSALIWAASCLSAAAQSAPVPAAAQTRVDITAPPSAPADDASALAEKLQNPSGASVQQLSPFGLRIRGSMVCCSTTSSRLAAPPVPLARITAS